MVLNKTTRIPGLKIVFKGLQTQQPFKDIFARSSLVSDQSYYWEKGFTNPCVIFYL